MNKLVCRDLDGFLGLSSHGVQKRNPEETWGHPGERCEGLMSSSVNNGGKTDIQGDSMHNHLTDLKSAGGISTIGRMKRRGLFWREGTASVWEHTSVSKCERPSHWGNFHDQRWPQWSIPVISLSLFTDGKINPWFSFKDKRVPISKSEFLLSFKIENAKEY